MPLTRAYKETVVRRIEQDPAFAAALYAEALEALIQGERQSALSILRDLVHARITFARLAEETGLGEKSLHRMLGRNGNPNMKSLSGVLRQIKEDLELDAQITVKCIVGSRTRRRRTRGALQAS